ncbi:MAG: hypothetical protein V3U07_00820, partial [Nitrospirales bacterium]
ASKVVVTTFASNCRSSTLMAEKPLSEFGQQDPQRHSPALIFWSRQFAEPYSHAGEFDHSPAVPGISMDQSRSPNNEAR